MGAYPDYDDEGPDPEDQEVFFNGWKFRDAILQLAPRRHVMITSFSVSLFTQHTIQFFVSLSERAASVRMIVWCNPQMPGSQFMERMTMLMSLQHLTNFRFDIRVHAKIHAKVVLIGSEPRTMLGWGGSLNMVDPVMTDLMLRMNPRQTFSVHKYTEKWWEEATPLSEAIAAPLSLL